jgi:serine/threonine protein kinase
MTDVEVRHCTTSRNRGETLTVNYLRHNLPYGVLLVNYHLPAGAGTREIDVIVLNYNGVYLLEVKHWYGPIVGDQVHWRHASGELRPSPIPIIEQKAKETNGFLAQQGWRDVSVTGMVVLSKGAGALQLDDPQAHKVFGLHESLIEALTGREYVFHPQSKILSSSEVRRLRQTLLDSHVTDADRRVFGYTVLEECGRDHYLGLIAEDPEFPGRRVRIKQYDVPEIGSWRELQQAVSRFKRDIEALYEAGPHPNLVRPYRFRRDQSSDERYYLIVVDWVAERTLTERLAQGPMAAEEQLGILNDVAAGLAHCHAHGVYHRNLSPDSIFLSADGQAKVGDFDFAKVPTVTKTLAQAGKKLVEGRHVSPEQAFHASHIDQRADIFSLGAVWYEMLFRPQPDAVIDRSRIEDAPLPDDGKEILRMMLAERVDERPSSMGEVREWLGVITGVGGTSD